MIQLTRTILVVLLLSAPIGLEASAAPLLERDAKTEQPRAYSLSAAYPNPFNPTTTFTLTVRDRQKVEVEVYNMLGQPVQDLYSGVMQAGESRSFTFEAGSLPSGIYFYRVTADNFTAARQVTLLK